MNSTAKRFWMNSLVRLGILTGFLGSLVLFSGTLTGEEPSDGRKKKADIINYREPRREFQWQPARTLPPRPDK